ncbi:MAG: NAD(P)-dependent oxidoreductase, partial [Pseudomonadota bacterium]
MAVARRVAEADRYVHVGRWRTWGPRVLLGHDIYGATLGIVGWGAIGRATARRGAGFNMRILYAANPAHDGAGGASGHYAIAPTTADSAGDAFLANAERVPLDRLLRESDFISLHVPLTAKTHHLIGAREFAMMKPGAILINTARGAVVDQGALTAALKSERLGGAGLDVTEKEPIEPDDPLLQMANVVITPHIGSASHATRLKMAELAVDNLLDVFAGKLPRSCANRSVRLKS